MRDDKLPPVGTTMYFVRRHYYYKKGRAAIRWEYIVVRGEVTRHLAGPRREFSLQGKSPEGFIELVYLTSQDIGKKAFFAAREAAELAQRMTEDYERIWAWTERWGDVPLRRPWEHLLKEGEV